MREQAARGRSDPKSVMRYFRIGGVRTFHLLLTRTDLYYDKYMKYLVPTDRQGRDTFTGAQRRTLAEFFFGLRRDGLCTTTTRAYHSTHEFEPLFIHIGCAYSWFTALCPVNLLIYGHSKYRVLIVYVTAL